MPKIAAIFDDFLQRGGSDLHLSPGAPPMMRLRGELLLLGDRPLGDGDVADLVMEILPAAEAKRLAEDFDVDFVHAHGQGSGPGAKTARLRVSLFHKAGGIAAAFRAIPSRVLSLAELGCPEVLWRLADRKAGLLVVAGPAGSGKTTTVAAMIDHINKTRACNILTIERPVEYVHEPLRSNVTQREIGKDTPSFAAALVNARREDPDVVVAGELSDAGAIRAALELARSGVLVIAVVLAGGAASAVERLVARFGHGEDVEARALLASSVVGVVVQQLLVTADGAGRVAAHEILLASPGATALIRGAITAELAPLMREGEAAGMQTMEMALERLITLGRISPEVALEAAQDRQAITRIVGQIRPDLVGG